MSKIDRTHIEVDANDLEYYSTSVATIRVLDKKGQRFTDCHLSLSMNRGRVKLLITHEKGYPSQELGMSQKEMTLKWLSNDVPKV